MYFPNTYFPQSYFSKSYFSVIPSISISIIPHIFTSRLGTPLIIIPGYHISIYSINQSLSFNQSFSKATIFNRSLSDFLSLNQTFSKAIIHNYSFSDLLSFNQSFSNTISGIHSFLDTLSFNQSLSNNAIHIRSLSNNLSFNQSLSNNIIRNYSLSNTLTFNQSLSSSSIHNRSILNTLTFNQTFQKTIIYNRSILNTISFNQNIHIPIKYNYTFPNDLINFIQTIIYDVPSLKQIISRSKQTFEMPSNYKLTTLNNSFVTHYSTIVTYTYTFTLLPKDLIPFKRFFNYNRFDPFTINKRVAYLRQDNADALNMFSGNLNLTLKFDVIDG